MDTERGAEQKDLRRWQIESLTNFIETVYTKKDGSTHTVQKPLEPTDASSSLIVKVGLNKQIASAEVSIQKSYLYSREVYAPQGNETFDKIKVSIKNGRAIDCVILLGYMNDGERIEKQYFFDSESKPRESIINGVMHQTWQETTGQITEKIISDEIRRLADSLPSQTCASIKAGLEYLILPAKNPRN